MTVFVAREIGKIGEIRGIETFAKAFCKDDHTMRATLGRALEDRSLDTSRKSFQLDLLVAKFLCDDREGRARRVGRTECEVTRVAAHQYDDVPAARGASVLEECAQNSRGGGASGFEAERGYAQRKRQVVVDRLRDVRHAKVLAGRLRDGLRREASVVAADRDQMVDAEPLESVDDAREISRFASRIRA